MDCKKTKEEIKDEALEWINGTRSMTNIVPQHPYETWAERITRADAAMVEQSYWILRAYKEGLL